MEEIQKIIGSMDPEEALNEISMALKTLFLTLGDQTRSEFLWGIEDEFISLLRKHGHLNPGELAEKTGLSLRGTTFLLSKLSREGKV